MADFLPVFFMKDEWRPDTFVYFASGASRDRCKILMPGSLSIADPLKMEILSPQSLSR
jgi:hypothetical protein